jgi:hypothetical protein
MADSSTLERLAADGFVAVDLNELFDLVEWCWDWGIATGDARYCVMWRVLHAVEEWLREHQEQGIATRLLDHVDGLVRRGLTDALAASAASSGAQFVHQMGMDLPLLRTPDEWRAAGWCDE